MQMITEGLENKRTYSLRDFTRLAIAFFCTLIVLGLYQQLRLYAQGVLDSVIGKSWFLLVLHHLGYAAIAVLPLAFLFNFLENKRISLGFRSVRWILLFLLLFEGFLIEFYVTHFEILGQGFADIYATRTSFAEWMLALAVLMPICLGSYWLFYKISSSTYRLIGRMYPFTIILFSLFLATQFSTKKPVNENKTQHLLVDIASGWIEEDRYAGAEEYPLSSEFIPDTGLSSYFHFGDTPPNLVFVIMDGLGSEFVGPDASYKAFAPFLNSLSQESLFWPNHLSNTAESHASLPSILGSLPFGEAGFNMAEGPVNRNTLLGILKTNGYSTSFNYGGNTALYKWDKFLFEDRIDQILDNKGFGEGYEKQETDAAGVTLGYPDMELFRKWLGERSDPDTPFAEVFFTLSTKKPFLIPRRDYYLDQVKLMAEDEGTLSQISGQIRRNKEILASVLYADEALKKFIERFKGLPYYQNTIFVITGSHMMAEISGLDPLSRYKVPLIIYSPLNTKPEIFRNMVSHMDISPAILGSLKDSYNIQVPGATGFLGNGLIPQKDADINKQIPLLRHASNIKDFIRGKYLLSDGFTYKIGPNLSLSDSENETEESEVIAAFSQFKGINKYVVEQNKLIPESSVLFTQTARRPSNQEMIWINSVFNGSDYDNAYETARALAHDGDRERALLLCSYILSQVPGHADTEILMGRIHAWAGDYKTAIEILETAVLKYPVYTDAYAALLDVYFWAGKKGKTEMLERKMIQNRLYSEDLKNKLNRIKSAEVSTQTSLEFSE